MSIEYRFSLNFIFSKTLLQSESLALSSCLSPERFRCVHVVCFAEEPDDDENQNGALITTGPQKKLRFVQLYTSHSYENRRSELLNPPESNGMRRSGSTENLQKHVLSPRLVDAISETAQVVWANTKRQEGLTGRSDIRLQTAVGMPVAMDESGNMCVVVMFSPNNIQSTDDAMEYLESISRSATSSSIPCLLPVFDPKTSRLKEIPHFDTSNALVSHDLGEGISTRFVSLELFWWQHFKAFFYSWLIYIGELQVFF